MGQPHRPVVKRTARAILLDVPAEAVQAVGLDGPRAPAETVPAEIVFIKRTKPGLPPYWITPGGGVEPTDATVVDALHREIAEELGGKVTDVVPAFVDTVRDPRPGIPEGVKVQHFFVCRLESMDPALRHGPEVEEPNGEYEIVRLPFTLEGVTSVNVVPAALRRYLAANVEGIRTLLAGDLGGRVAGRA
ncbi:NUDIX domain-containing protein [Phaeacidiphilus oryzae]|jgi:8-oxo-dGTP pyrophosphatase MutT (NUDIX family)|uniref:NUDIX domain-containing protein n=1 Tax=Phaeacidiphilus oryzae TaxID=348818 RepID=UPI0005687850|nr:NUDIX hydrolase [Phaeacidiphilus oryzae]